MTWDVRVLLALYVVGYVVFFWVNVNRLEQEREEFGRGGLSFLPFALMMALMSLAWPVIEVYRRVR